MAGFSDERLLGHWDEAVVNHADKVAESGGEQSLAETGFFTDGVGIRP